MIPKIIHYIWFGGKPYSKKIAKCINSWQKYMPDYEFKLWNENTFDIDNSCKFVKEAYAQKKYAFVSDYVRVYALYKFGGIYLDTDIELIKPIDNAILNTGMCILGTDESGYLTALMISCAKHPYFEELLNYYNSINFINKNGSLNMEVNNTYMQQILSNYGYKISNTLQRLSNNIHVYPDDYFHARSLTSGKLNITKNTYSIHWHTITWVPLKTRIINFIRINLLVPFLGTKLYSKLTKKIKNGKTTI